MTDEMSPDYKAGHTAGLQEAWEDFGEKPLSVMQMKALTAHLNPARVASRSQGGASLSYLETWDVRASLIRVFGFGRWSADLVEPVNVLRIDEVPSSRDPNKKNFRVLALATVRLTIHQLGCTYTESASASQTGPDIGEVTDFAVKTAESDALKRAAINLGTQFGLSLYDSGSTLDVVKVVLAPGQHEVLEQARPKPTSAPAPTAAETPAPGEDPRDDLPMVLEGMPEPTEPRVSRTSIRQGFDRGTR